MMCGEKTWQEEWMAGSNEAAPSVELGARLLHAALSVLKEAGGEAPGRQVMDAAGQRVELDDWARERYEKTGNVRWQSLLHFFTIDAAKAGYLIKKKGVWYLTPEGDKALSLKPLALLDQARKAYREWRKENPVETEVELPSSAGTQIEVSPETRSPSLDEIEQLALEDIQTAINQKTPYEFQDLVAALLRGMGYFTPFVAPAGKDGGVDIIAYRDPLGTMSPRIKVQVKHRTSPTGVQDVRQLMGLLQKDGDVGIFVSTGGFSADARAAARSSHVHVELIDGSRFITLWQEFYEKLSDEDKALLPLRPVYFVASEE
jgi:restriction system protein